MSFTWIVNAVSHQGGRHHIGRLGSVVAADIHMARIEAQMRYGGLDYALYVQSAVSSSIANDDVSALRLRSKALPRRDYAKKKPQSDAESIVCESVSEAAGLECKFESRV